MYPYAGTLPGPRTPMVLVGTRLSEVRGFSDFFSEFFTALRKVHFPPNLRMVVLCTRPNYELRAFQASPASPLHVHQLMVRFQLLACTGMAFGSFLGKRDENRDHALFTP